MTVIQKIVEAAGTLQEFPLSGRIVPEFSEKNIREIFVFKYRVIYRVKTKGWKFFRATIAP